MHRRLVCVLGAAVLAVASSVAFVAPAEAVAHTSTGLRCTIVGTAHNDRLVGTRRNDVICGGGGNDTIYGGGGNDVIDAGAGNDAVHGGAGNDRVYGGLGRDNISGDDGADSVNGQADADIVHGGTGNDSVNGSTGDDRIDGGSGDDHLVGGSGNDTLTGSQNADSLYGDAGNDDLSGGPGVDVVNGGTGTNWCDVASEDHQVACKVDSQAPVVQGIVVDRPTVDVSGASAGVHIRVHATDDTGVHHIRIEAFRQDGSSTNLTANGPRVSGSPRDGWWEASMTVPRYIDAGTWDLVVDVYDRVSRSGDRTFPAALTVRDSTPDDDPAQVLGVQVLPGSVDVTKQSVTVEAKIHVKDAVSGVQLVFVCPHVLTDSGWADAESYGCTGSDLRVSGTYKDGVWLIPVEIPKGARSGVWDFGADVSDRAHPNDQSHWVGVDEAAYDRAHGIDDGSPVVPGSGARLTVKGVDSDTHAPELISVTATPQTVDASHGARTVTVDVAARDVEGLSEVHVAVHSGDDQLDLQDDAFYGDLVSGTDQDGVWRFTFQVPGGMPPGEYYIETWLQDSVHQEGWAPADHTWGGYYQAYSTSQSPNSGYLTVQ